MDILSNPKAFLSEQEKRAKQLQTMGIEASDISTQDLKGNKVTTSNVHSNSIASLSMASIQQPKKNLDRKGSLYIVIFPLNYVYL